MSRTTINGTVEKVFGSSAKIVSPGRKMNSKYLKSVKSDKKYLAENSKPAAQEGDAVVIEEVAPISKKKTWKIIKIVNKK